MVTIVFLLVQKCHLLSESESAFIFMPSVAFVANFNRMMENNINLDKLSGIICHQHMHYTTVDRARIKCIIIVILCTLYCNVFSLVNET